MITREQLINKYLQFFSSKKHAIIPSSSLVPANDPTVLFTTAGMHPLVPYLLGQPHPLGKRLADVQKCIRTGDIEEVGDATHHTFFEMLGNWSLGDYWKKESIEWSFEFLTKVLKIPLEKLAVTIFEGDSHAPRDTESEKIWLSLGVHKDRLVALGKEDNWWGPAGTTGPCGPDTEIFYWSASAPAPKKYDPKDKRWVEIWNNVFMEYERKNDGKYHKAKQRNVDTGMGVERTLAALNSLDDNYLTEAFLPIIKEIENISKKEYKIEMNKGEMRIIADHVRTATFILSERISPSNNGQGYVLRRLIRRAIRYGNSLKIKNFLPQLSKIIIKQYQEYPELKENESFILGELEKEEEKFTKTIESGIREFEKLSKNKMITKEQAFLLYQSYGFPIELTEELAKENGIDLDKKGFEIEYQKHKELSRSSSAGMFKSGLADHSETTTRLHTATHLLNEALRHVLGPDVKQRGSNITPERLRFDFSFPRKLTSEELTYIEKLVNEKIKAHLAVTRTEVKHAQALKEDAQAEFGHKYPDMVSVYTIEDKSKRGWFSKEICTGPHVSNTKEVGTFKIVKEESVSAGVRRIKATVS